MKPLALLIPGSLNDAEVWHDVAIALQDLAEVRIADVSRGQDMAAMAALAWRAVEDIAPERPFVLAGFSMGGYVAIEMLAHPRRAVHAAALVSTSARPETDEGRAARAKSIRAFERDFPRAVQGICEWGTHQAGPGLLQRLGQMMLRVGADTAVRQMQAMAQRHDLRGPLSQLRLPVVVACGTEDRITPLHLSQELAELIPHASLHQASGCGHMLPLEQPAFLARCLRPLLVAERAPTFHHNTGDKP